MRRHWLVHLLVDQRYRPDCLVLRRPIPSRRFDSQRQIFLRVLPRSPLPRLPLRDLEDLQLVQSPVAPPALRRHQGYRYLQRYEAVSIGEREWSWGGRRKEAHEHRALAGGRRNEKGRQGTLHEHNPHRHLGGFIVDRLLKAAVLKSTTLVVEVRSMQKCKSIISIISAILRGC